MARWKGISLSNLVERTRLNLRDWVAYRIDFYHRRFYCYQHRRDDGHSKQVVLARNLCVKVQEQPGGPSKAVEYWSRSQNKVEWAYETSHRECMAVVWAVLLRPCLKESWFTSRTNHDALRWILNMMSVTEKLVG